ncbi:MAG: M14 family metallopeptidase [Hyphococcus sp.]
MLKITSDFDHGNIRCLSADAPDDIRLEINPDGDTDFLQWFYFQLEDGKGKDLELRLLNAGKASYQNGWHDYRAVASYDQKEWFRVETVFDGETLTIRHRPEQDRVFYAYFAAYPTSRHRAVINDIKSFSAFEHSALGNTLDGQEIDYFQAGSGALNLWVIARQHPGETMGSWWMEGFLRRLADTDDDIAQSILRQARLHVVPCMNLDGARLGHLRTNAAGIDLNRAWRNTTMALSPEVFLTRERMRETGVDFFLDVHGDEAIPNNFLDGAEGIPSWNAQHAARFEAYSALLLDISPDFQTKDGYPTPPPGRANLDIATNYVAETWGCLAMTLEMPFKDAAVNTDPVYGWSPERCRQMGRDNLAAMERIIGELR